jgi:hypothetical protein
MAMTTDTTPTKTPKETVDLAKLGLDLAAMTRRVRGFNLALGFLHNAYSEELLDAVEQLALDIEREAERLERSCDEMVAEQVTL